jgi:hypothetical protein
MNNDEKLTVIIVSILGLCLLALSLWAQEKPKGAAQPAAEVAQAEKPAEAAPPAVPDALLKRFWKALYGLNQANQACQQTPQMKAATAQMDAASDQLRAFCGKWGVHIDQASQEPRCGPPPEQARQP